MFDIGYFFGAFAMSFGFGVIGYLVTMPFTKDQKVRFGVAMGVVAVLAFLPSAMEMSAPSIAASLAAIGALYWRMTIAIKAPPEAAAD